MGTSDQTLVGSLRPTRQRLAVLEVLASLEDFRSAQDIHALLGERGEAVGLATVYRTLQLLADHEEIDRLVDEGGEAIYRACSHTHHHLLRCRGCDLAVEVDGPVVERWARAVAAEHGFGDVVHSLELLGTCRTCGSQDPGLSTRRR